VELLLEDREVGAELLGVELRCSRNSHRLNCNVRRPAGRPTLLNRDDFEVVERCADADRRGAVVAGDRAGGIRAGLPRTGRARLDLDEREPPGRG
jgi:hypothetical protein